MKNIFFINHARAVFYFLLLFNLLTTSSCEKGAQSDISLQMASLNQSAASSENFAAAGIDTAGLVAWFDFNNGSLKDKSSYYNKIIFNNAQRANDRNDVANNAYYFNGKNSYMEVANSPSLNPSKAITLFVIVKISDFYAGKCHNNRILCKGYFDDDPGVYTMDFSDALYTNHTNCGQAVDKAHQSFDGTFCGTGATDSTQFVQANHWYHLIYTYQNKAGKLYVDGKLISVYNGGGFFSSNNYNLYFGTTNKYQHQYPYWFNGTIDQVGIFNTAINETQVTRLSNL